MMKNILVLTVILIFVAACGKNTHNTSVEGPKTQKAVITISGMSCTGCEETITKGALALDGVKEAKASYVDGIAWITYDMNRVNLDQITASIEKKGCKVTGVTSLPEADSVSN
jgi:copper chaperone CopZ